ncbi:8057_t:CDS:2, partial [Entrophospora sp. SA101]
EMTLKGILNDQPYTITNTIKSHWSHMTWSATSMKSMIMIDIKEENEANQFEENDSNERLDDGRAQSKPGFLFELLVLLE